MAELDTNETKIDVGSSEINAAWIYNAMGKVNVRQMISTLTIYEDIASPFMSGKLVMTDTLNLLDDMLFRGEERLRLEMRTPGYDIERVGEFFIYKLEDRENKSLRGVIYTLRFVSIEAFTDINAKISRTFRGSIGDTVKRLCQKGLLTEKEILIQPTVNSHIHTSNNWSPIQNINYLTKKSVGSNNQPDYVFFECDEGFVFGSLSSMFDLPIQQQFIKGHHSRGTDPVEDVDIEYNKIMDMSIPMMYDYIVRHDNQGYGGSLYVTDIEKKDIHLFQYNAKDDKNRKLLNEGGNTFDTAEEPFYVESIIGTKYIHSDLFENLPTQMNNDITRRNSILTQTEFIKTNIKVFGRMDYTVGRIVELIIYQDKEMDNEDQEEDRIDRTLSGRYLVAKVTHDINTKSHWCYMELIKDSYTK